MSTTEILMETELVVVATDQEATLDASVRRLHDCLRAHADAHRTRRWRLTVVDNGSVDDTAAVVERLALTLDRVRGVLLPTRIARAELRDHWAHGAAATVVFCSVGPDTDLAALLAPVFEHDAPTLGRRPRLLARRAALATIGGIGITVVAAACGSKAKTATDATTSTTAAGSSTTASSDTPNTTSNTTSNTTGATSVVLAPEMTEGPYYLDLDEVRSDITEDRKGAPLALTLTVADVATGSPIKGASVDIWHCDADGLYSGFVSQSAGANGGSSSADDGTFLRGTQVSDARGEVTFATIYPGWYRGRTVHIHVKVHVGGSVVHVGQLFFDDSFTDAVFAAKAPYSARGERDTRNANDGIFSGGGDRSLLPVKAAGTGYAASLATGVKTA